MSHILTNRYTLRLLFSILLLSLPLVGQAQTRSKTTPQPFTGVYVGLQAGVMHGLADQSSILSISPVERFQENSVLANKVANELGNFPHPFFSHQTQQGFMGGLLVGFGEIVNHKFYRGVELSVLWNTAATASDTETQGRFIIAGIKSGTIKPPLFSRELITRSANLDYNVNLTFNPGLLFQVKPITTLVYTKVGVSYGRLIYKQHFNLLGAIEGADIFGQPPSFGFLPAFSIREHVEGTLKSKLGFTAGIGAKLMLTDQLATSVEYNYYDYGTIHLENTTICTHPILDEESSKQILFPINQNCDEEGEGESIRMTNQHARIHASLVSVGLVWHIPPTT